MGGPKDTDRPPLAPGVASAFSGEAWTHPIGRSAGFRHDAGKLH